MLGVPRIARSHGDTTVSAGSDSGTLVRENLARPDDGIAGHGCPETGEPTRMLPGMNATPPSGQGPPPDAEPAKLRPSRVWYTVAAVVVVLGLAGAGTFIALGATSFPKPTATVPSSGESKQVDLEDPGLTVFIDRTGVSGRCEVLSEDDENIDLAPIKGKESVTINGDQWYAVLRTPGEVPAGTYRVSCTGESADAHFAVGPHRSVFASLGMLFGGIGIAFVGVMGAFVIWLVTFLRRRAARRWTRQATPYGFPPQHPGPPPPGPPLPPASGG